MEAMERRAHIRYDFQEEVQYINPDTPEEIFDGVVVNFSQSGVCLYMLSPLRVGQEITIMNEHGYQYRKKGVVVWCNKWGENVDIYRAGVKLP